MSLCQFQSLWRHHYVNSTYYPKRALNKDLEGLSSSLEPGTPCINLVMLIHLFWKRSVMLIKYLTWSPTFSSISCGEVGVMWSRGMYVTSDLRELSETVFPMISVLVKSNKQRISNGKLARWKQGDLIDVKCRGEPLIHDHVSNK